MEALKWRFPCVAGGQSTGSTIADKEIYRKSLYTSLAREILQNSIDACLDDSEPVFIEFKTFNIKTGNIPDLIGLKDQIKRCIDYSQYNSDTVNSYNKILNILENEEIECLRISDFNTTGLLGVSSDDFKNNNFKALVKGAGISIKKSETAGGSKGVGKNAAVVLSNIFCVWYSTITSKKEKGSIGKADFISGYHKDHLNDTNYCTQGAGFLSDNEMNKPIHDIMNLDINYNREKSGTDIYILAFRKDDNWENEIIQSVIESFIVAIYYKKLKINVNGINIDYSTLKDIIFNNAIISADKVYKAALSTYKILSNEDKNVRSFDIELGDLGDASLYIMPLKQNQGNYATNKCDLVRWPYMKIKECCSIQYYKFSALCLIRDNLLGKFLRKYETSEHNDWQPNLATDNLSKKKAKKTIKKLISTIEEKIEEIFNTNSANIIDPNKAAEFLAAPVNEGISGNEKTNNNCNIDSDKVIIGKLRKSNFVSMKSDFDDDKGISVNPMIGAIDNDQEEGLFYPQGHNKNDGGNPRLGKETAGFKSGDTIVLAKDDKSPIKYKLIAINTNEGRYKIVFISPKTYNECYLKLSILDIANDDKEIAIKSMNCDGEDIDIKDQFQPGPFKISMNKKCVIEIQTVTQRGNFASEVKVLCK